MAAVLGGSSKSVRLLWTMPRHSCNRPASAWGRCCACGRGDHSQGVAQAGLPCVLRLFVPAQSGLRLGDQAVGFSQIGCDIDEACILGQEELLGLLQFIQGFMLPVLLQICPADVLVYDRFECSTSGISGLLQSIRQLRKRPVRIMEVDDIKPRQIIVGWYGCRPVPGLADTQLRRSCS